MVSHDFGEESNHLFLKWNVRSLLIGLEYEGTQST